MIKKQKTFKEHMKGMNYNQIIAGILTVAILSLIIFAGPVKAFSLGLNTDKDTLITGEEITFTATLNIEDMDQYLPIKELSLTFNDAQVCKFDVNGNEISGCEGMTITLILNDLSAHGGYGYGYGEDNTYGYGYGYDFGYDYGYGYGYGYGGNELNLIYQITLDTTGYEAGDYISQLKALIGDKTFQSREKTFTITAANLGNPNGPGGSNNNNNNDNSIQISQTTLELIIGINKLNLNTSYPFMIGDEEHTLIITSIIGDEVWITINSEPQQVKLSLEEKIAEIDVNGDGINDIKLQLMTIEGNQVKLVYYVLDNQGGPVGEPEVIDFKEPNIFSKITGAVTGALGTAGTTVAIVFILGILGSAVFVSQKRKKKDPKQ